MTTTTLMNIDETAASVSVDNEFDFSQLDETLIGNNQKQALIDYVSQLKAQKRSINDDYAAFKLSTGDEISSNLLVYLLDRKTSLIVSSDNVRPIASHPGDRVYVRLNSAAHEFTHQAIVLMINFDRNPKRSENDEQQSKTASKRRCSIPPASMSMPTICSTQVPLSNMRTMLETLIYIVHEINLEQAKLTTTMNKLIARTNQNETYLNQLNSNIESLCEQFIVVSSMNKQQDFNDDEKSNEGDSSKEKSEFEIEPIELPDSPQLSSSLSSNTSATIDESFQQPLNMSTTTNLVPMVQANYLSLFNIPQTEMPPPPSSNKSNGKTSYNKELIELGDPSNGLSCKVLKRKYDQVRRRTELAYVHGEKRAIGRLLTFLIRQFFSNDELRNASLDGRVRNTQPLSPDRMRLIDTHLQSIFGIDYALYRITKDCAEQVNVVCRHARNPKNLFEIGTSTQVKIETTLPVSYVMNDDDNEEQFQEQLFIQANEQRFHELTREYENVRDEVFKQRESEQQFRTHNDQLQQISNELEQQLSTVRQNEQQLNAKLEAIMEQTRQLSAEKEQQSMLISEKEKEIYELQKQREIIEDENRQVHNTNTSTIARLQELESTSVQLQSLEQLWNKERQLYTEQIQTLEHSLVETKKISIEQQTQIMQLTVQLQSVDGQFQGQKRSLDTSIDEKNQSILNLDRQLREKIQRVDQLQTDLQRTVRQMENQQLSSNKTIQSLKSQIDELLKKNVILNDQCDEQSQVLIKISSERDVIKTEMGILTEMFEKQSTENEQTIRRLQDELDNTTQLLESIRSKGADLTQLSNFLDGTLSHIRSSDPTSTTIPAPGTPVCQECRQLKSALVLEITGKERFRFGYEQLSAMVKEAAPILRRQKQDYEASFEVIAKLTSELNEARKELSELQHMSGESIENYRYIQRENQFLTSDNKSLGTKIQVLLAEIEELRTGTRPADRERSTEYDPNQQVPLTFRNVVELQHVNQKLDKMVREMRAHNTIDDEDLNRTRFDELKKEHQQQQEKLKEAKNQLDNLETQMTSLIQERDFLRLLVSRSSSSQSTTSTVTSIDVHQIENLRDQIARLQEKIELLNKKNTQLMNEKDDVIRISNEKVRSLQYELLTARTEVEQTLAKFNLINDEQATNRLTIASLRTEINSWQERHSTIVQIKNKQEQQYYDMLTELRQLKDEKTSIEWRMNTIENERKFDSIKFEQVENECMLLKSEIVKNEQIHPIIEKLQNLAEFTKEKTKAMFEAKLNDLMAQNDELRQRIEQNERDRENMDRTHQSRLDEIVQTLQQEKLSHAETRTKVMAERERAEQAQRQFRELENKLNSNNTQKTDFEQQLGDYEKEIKMLKVKLDAANHELELKQTLIQSNIDNVNELNMNGQKTFEELEKVKQDFAQKTSEYENEIERLKQELVNRQSIEVQNDEFTRSLNERIQTILEQHHTELTQANESTERVIAEKNQLTQQLQDLEQFIRESKAENEQLLEKMNQLEANMETYRIHADELARRNDELVQEMTTLQNENDRLIAQMQHYETTLTSKDDALKIQQQISEQFEERYVELEKKHSEQHALMIKLSTHLAAKESETNVNSIPISTDSSPVNESWGSILAMNNYLRVENTRLIDDIERMRLENARINERSNTLEQRYVDDQQMIEELRAKNLSLHSLEERFDADQQQLIIQREQCQTFEQQVQRYEQDTNRLEKTIDELNQRKQTLINQLGDTEEKTRTIEEQLTAKKAEVERQGHEMETCKARITKFEAENQELKQMITKLKAIAIKYRTTATAATAATTLTPSLSSAASTSSETDELLTAPPTDAATVGEPSADANKTRSLPLDLTEKMNKLRDALLHARSTIAALQNRTSQMVSELARARQSRIASDLTEVHALVDSIRQTYESEINDLKHTLQLFDNTDSNEHMAEILRLRKKLDELTASISVKSTSTAGVITSTSTSSSTTPKPSEDVTPKSVKPQAIAAPMTQEPVISRVAPMAPSTGRQIGVAIPMTASTTATTTSSTLWASSTTTETASSQTAAAVAAPVEHITPFTGATQLSTPAGVNLLMKRSRTDDDHKSTESTLKRSKPETDTAPLIAHVEPQVREQQPTTNVILQEPPETIDAGVAEPSRVDEPSTHAELETGNMGVEEASLTDQPPESDSRSLGGGVVGNLGEATTTNEPGNVGSEQSSDQRRGDILPIVYDVQSIPTIGSGGSAQLNRGSGGRQRPFMSISATRRVWSTRGAGGRGGVSGRGAGGSGGAGGVGPSPRQ